MSTPARALVLPSRAFERTTTAQLRDAVAYADPDLLVATSPGARYRIRSTLPEAADLPTVAPGGDRSDADEHAVGDVRVVADPGDDAVAPPTAFGADGTGTTYVVTDRLSLEVRPSELRAEVVGLDEYRAAFGDDETAAADRVVHLSTALPAGYYREWDGLTVRGIGPDRDASGGRGGEPTLRALTLGADGAVATTDVRPSSLGLRAIRGVGETRARALRAAGYHTRSDVAEADVTALADVESLGRDSAARLRWHARAFVDGEVVRRGDEYFPNREPVFVDIETDGLSPSVVWLIGVLDRTPVGGASAEGSESGGGGRETYMSFLNRDPDEPGRALSAFLAWYAANAAGRPVVAYNGLSFDFPVIEEQAERHCPEYLDDWRDAWTFDPYAWAVSDGNAVLPGRTNRLEDVAAALGYEPADDGGAAALSGAEVARRYREYASGGPEPDWDALEAYCEDDVRALAHVYDALDAAERTESGSDDRSAAPGTNTTQGQLGDFG